MFSLCVDKVAHQSRCIFYFMKSDYSVTVLIPCHNEEQAIVEVVRELQQKLPGCAIVVIDNLSTDSTAQFAESAGAQVISEPRLGKGYAMRRGISSTDSDVYVMLDGDGTYGIENLPAAIEKVAHQGYDMVCGVRETASTGSLFSESDEYRQGHTLGNVLITKVLNLLFEMKLHDSLSGFRVFSRPFAKSFQHFSQGFELEIDFNVHASQLKIAVDEIPVTYKSRQPGSFSKLKTYQDGYRILLRLLGLFLDHRPQLATLLIAILPFGLSTFLILTPIQEYVETGMVGKFPSLIAGTSLLLLSCSIVTLGVILNKISSTRQLLIRQEYARSM